MTIIIAIGAWMLAVTLWFAVAAALACAIGAVIRLADRAAGNVDRVEMPVSSHGAPDTAGRRATS
jgi:hypothetical protein